MAPLSYRADLDGLRAIAIIMAILYHTGLDILPGGFIGIEMFFVLSGYLITSQLTADMLDNSFSFKAFYLRRFKRLLPTFAVVLLATFIVAWFILLPKDLVYHTKLMGLGFLSIGNFYLAKSTGGYFAPQTEEIALLHTWSLSVEEQFYLLWPVILFFVLKRFSYVNAIRIFAVLLVATIGFAEWQVITDPIKAYFLLPSRFYELLVGCLLAMIAGYLPKLSSGKASLLAIIGFTGILFNIFNENASHHFPGINALYACLGTASIIYAGFFSNTVTRIISNTQLVYIGKISYSLYLWHWPIFAFIHYTTGTITPLNACLAIVLSFVLSALTWKYIENPFRKKWRFPFGKTLMLMYVLPVFIFVAIYFTVKQGDGYITRFNANPAAIAAMEKRPATYNETCEPQATDCQQILLIGDSHADHFSPFIHALISNNPGFKMHTQWKPFCPPLMDIYRASVDDKTGDIEELREDACYTHINDFYNTLDKSPYRYVVLGSFWANLDIYGGYFFDQENPQFNAETSHKVLRRSLYQSLKRLLDNGITPVIIEDNPDISEKTLKCSHRKILRPGFNDACTMPLNDFTAQQVFARQLLDDVKRDFPQVRFIQPAKVMCNDTDCLTEMQGMPLYRDRNHLSETGAEMLGLLYLEKFGLPFQASTIEKP